MVTLIYRYFADVVIYQSEFVRQCWYRHSSHRPRFQTVIYNAVDLNQFIPYQNKRYSDPNYKPKLLCVEGEVQGSDANIVPLINVANYLLQHNLISGVTVIGDISLTTRSRLETSISKIDIKGRLSRDQTRSYYPGSLYLPLEINAPCPNSIIEALACGCPVVGFNSGP